MNESVRVSFGRELMFKTLNANKEFCFLVDRAFDELLMENKVNAFTRVEIMAQIENSLTKLVRDNRDGPQ